MADAALSPRIVSPGDVRRLKRELEALDGYIRQAAVRKPGVTMQLPPLGRSLEALATDDGINLLQAEARQKLLEQLKHLVDKAPQIHISFAGEPSAAFLSKLVVWLRANINPQLLVVVGLQPTIAAGCIVRTDNKQFDFSLASRFDAQRELLINSLRGSTDGGVA